MRYIEGLKDHHKGQTCAVLGGGPSLVKDIQSLPDVDVLIGVNQHSMIMPLDYLAFIDSKVWPLVKDCDTTFITRSATVCDDKNNEAYDIIRYRQEIKPNYSGVLAIKAADQMGFSKIYVCGMSQYDPDDDRLYWWQGPQVAKTEKERKNRNVLSEILNSVRFLRHPHNVHFMSGRLKEKHQ